MRRVDGIGDGLAAERVSFRVVLERFRERLRVLERLAEREVEVIAVLFADVGPRELPAHDGDVARLEAERLEVGEAPPGLAEVGKKLGAPAVRIDAFVRPAKRLERVAVTHPAFRQRGLLAEKNFIDFDRFLVFADPDQRRRAQCAIARIAGLLRHQQIDLRERLLRFHLPVQDGGVVLPGRGEARCQFQHAREKMLGILVASEPRTGFRQHADRRDVCGMVLHERTQQPLGHGEAVLAQRGRGLDQLRIVDRRLDVARIGGIGCGAVVQHGVEVAEHAPRCSVVRIERRGA